MTTESNAVVMVGPSLVPLRVAAGIGIVVALAMIVAGFVVGLWWGLAALLAAPAIPLAFVLVTDRVRRR